MMKRMLGFCAGCCCAAAGVLAGPANESDISVAAPTSAAQERECQPLIFSRNTSRMFGGLFSRIHSDIA